MSRRTQKIILVISLLIIVFEVYDFVTTDTGHFLYSTATKNRGASNAGMILFAIIVAFFTARDLLKPDKKDPGHFNHKKSHES